MNVKTKAKILVDCLMTILLPVLMAWALIGDKAHEWIGVSMLLLFFLHHALNYRWSISLFKGRYTCMRIIQTVLDFILLLIMLTQMVSGIMLSKYVFSGLPIPSGSALARAGHLLASHWGFVLMSLHAGLHGNMLGAMLKNKCQASKVLSLLRMPFKIAAILIAAYGVVAFIRRKFLSYMFLTNQFYFVNFDEPLALFLVDYLAMMTLFFIGGYILSTAIRKHTKNRLSG